MLIHKEVSRYFSLTLLKQSDGLEDDEKDLTLFDNYDFVEKKSSR